MNRGSQFQNEVIGHATPKKKKNSHDTLYVEIIEQECTICGRKLSRKERIETHLSYVHSKGEKTTQVNHIRKYQRYQGDLSVPIPKSTRLDSNKRSATRSNTANHLDSSVGLSTELAVVPTESSASHNGENICTRDRSNYMRLQRCIGILVCKWLCTVRSVPELGKGWRERRYKVVILYYK